MPKSECISELPAAIYSRDITADELPRERHWFVLRVTPRHEKSVSRILETLGHITFLPLFAKHHHYGGRHRRFGLPVFPGYLFWHCDTARPVSPPRLPSVLGFIHNQGKALPVTDEEIYAIQTVTEKRIPLQPWPYLETGDTVRIVEGS